MTSLPNLIRQILGSLCQMLLQPLRRWSKPDNHAPIPNAVLDGTRNKSELVLENVLLRQQVIVLQRQTKRPKLTWHDRALFVLLTSKLRAWKQALIIVRPDTLLRWHRDLFRRIWRRKSKPKHKRGRKPLTQEHIALIRRMAKENLTRGAERIRGELLKLQIEVSKSTIQKYMKQVRERGPSKQTWSTFLRNHAQEIWASHFAQTYDLFFRALFVFVIIELGSRRLVHFGVTRNPTDAWIAQQLRNATPFGQRPRYLIRDNDPKYRPSLDRAAAGIEVLRTPYGAPKASAICERFLGSVRRECLDFFLILDDRHLHRVTKEYQAYFDHARPHQGIAQHIPCQSEQPNAPPLDAKIVSQPLLGGLHHDYYWQAADSTSLSRVA
jgi:putative transposase